MFYIETSTKSPPDNVDLAFHDLIRVKYVFYIETSAKSPPVNVDLAFHNLVGVIK